MLAHFTLHQPRLDQLAYSHVGNNTLHSWLREVLVVLRLVEVQVQVQGGITRHHLRKNGVLLSPLAGPLLVGVERIKARQV